MKRLMMYVLVAIGGAILGAAIGLMGSRTVDVVHAQGVSFTGCKAAGGVSTPCSQYVLQVNTGRGLGRFVIYRVTTGPLDISGMERYAAGDPSVTATDNEATPRSTVPFTMSASE